LKRQQLILTFGGILLFTILYFFGQTLPPKKNNAPSDKEHFAQNDQKPIEFHDILKAYSSKLNSTQTSYINRLENSVVRGDVKNQQIAAYRQLAEFWKDSVENAFLPAAYYTAEAAKLENSEKNLTFAAQLFLDNLPGQNNQALKIWMANQAKSLFQRALQLNPYNDSSKIGLGGSYIFGGSGEPQEIMQGVQQILEVVNRDSTNMYGQFILGLGGIESGQFDKAITRLGKVVKYQPGNVEAVLALAEANQHMGNKEEAIKWYQAGRKLIVNPELDKEIDQRIKLLQ
jgi:thioredoxin-like negative regulator of GroEL